MLTKLLYKQFLTESKQNDLLSVHYSLNFQKKVVKPPFTLLCPPSLAQEPLQRSINNVKELVD